MEIHVNSLHDLMPAFFPRMKRNYGNLRKYMNGLQTNCTRRRKYDLVAIIWIEEISKPIPLVEISY